jgi:serine/threonine protein kinase/formylglycine-generating enzyme required for sulfatase activity/WD40 repeat protein
MPQDEITQAIRARRVLTGDEGAVALAAEKGKLLSSQLQTMQPDETVIGDNVQIPPADPNATVTFGSVQTPDEALNFLAPAQGPDELGRLGDYRILELLGMGGMGMVFRAEDARLKRQVALKVMKPSVAASRTAKDRFLREAQFTAAIEHDNIVQIFQVGEDNGVPFIAMPFLKGESLKTRQERVGRMSQKDVLKVGIQVAAGLAAAHDRNLIHRDIKPDNIWIEEKTGRAKILDFGLVRATSEDAGLTQSGMVMGTPRYMAPEQALGQDVDHRCDLFSLGSVLYHLASGKLPFEGSNVTATLMAVVQKDPKPLDAVISGLDPAFCDMIARLMRKNRDDRPKSAVEVAKALTAILQKLKQVDPTVTKAESTPKPVAELAKPEKAAGEIEALPVIVTEPVASLATKKAVKPKDAPAASSLQPPGKPPRRRFLAAAGAGGILLALLGIIVITIRDKDGKETVIRVPEGTEIDVAAEPGSKVTIRQEGMSTGASSISNAKSQISNPTTGWHGWPADAPKPAIAPFDAEQAKKHQEEWAAYLKVPVEYTNSIGMKFRLIPPGEFMMGSTEAQIQESLQLLDPTHMWREFVESERPQHKVVLTRPVYLGVTEVTQSQYTTVMKSNPSRFSASGPGKETVVGIPTESFPVESVTWYDAAELCAKLSQKDDLKPFYFRSGEQVTPLQGTGYRLPTEAEWEFACRAGTTSTFSVAEDPTLASSVGWSSTNSGNRTHPVAELPPNPFGLFDMHGNVWEWGDDFWSPSAYKNLAGSVAIDPIVRSRDDAHVIRGGGWDAHGPISGKNQVTSTRRRPSGIDGDVGFRVALSVDAVRQSPSLTDPAMRNADNSSVAATMPQPSTPLKPRVEIDLTPAPPLGTWEMGPEPPWYDQNFNGFGYSLKEAAVLPGIVDRPALIPGIKRWNVDTVWPRREFVTKVAYSPDGKWIGVLDTHLSIFDARTLKLHQLLPGFAPQYGAFDFSWSSDSQRIVVAADGTTKVRVFDVKGNLNHEAALRGTTRAVAWNPTADQFAVGISNAANHGSCIEIYNAAGELLKSFPEEAATPDLGVHKQGIIFSRDGKSLVAVHHDGKVRSWNIETGESTIIDEITVAEYFGSKLSWHESGWLAIATQTDVRIYSPDLKLDHTIPMEGVGDVEWHADGRRLLLGAYWLQVWDRIERKVVLSGEGRLQCGIHDSADWRPNGEEVVFTTNQGSLLGVAPANLKQLRFRSPEGAVQIVSELAWSPDGEVLASRIGSHYANAKFWAKDGHRNRSIFEDNSGDTRWLKWSTNGDELFFGSSKGVSATTLNGSVRNLYQTAALHWFGCVVSSPKWQGIIVSDGNGHLQILDRNGQPIQELATGGKACPFVIWNHTTDMLAVAEEGQPLKLLEHHDGWTLRTVSDVPLPHMQHTPVWSPDGKMLSIQSSRLWFDDTGKTLPEQSPAEAWRPDGQRYVSGQDGYLALWRRQDGRLTIRYPQGLLNYASAWHPRGHLFAAGTTSSRFTVWNEAEFQPYFHGVMLPDNKSATFSAAGELIDGKPEEIDQYLVYYIDRGDGRIETLTPAEFRKLLPGK